MPTSVQYRPEHFINRELSWLEFNARVLEEAQDPTNPLMERVKFLAIFSSNLDEFFMVRVAGLREQAFGGVTAQDVAADGLDALTQLQRISTRTRQLVADQYRCWNEEIAPALANAGIRFVSESELSKSQRKKVSNFFRQRAFPVLTPMAIDPSHPSPRFHNRGLYLAALLNRASGLGPPDLFAVVQAPQVLPRFLRIDESGPACFIPMEEVMASKLPELFGGYQIAKFATFRITRDMDFDLLEQEADDLLRAIEARLRARQRSEAVRLEIQSDMSADMLSMLVREEGLHDRLDVAGQEYSETYRIPGMIDMTGLWEIVKTPCDDSLREVPFTPRRSLRLTRPKDLFAEIADHDVLLHHPFDSFDAVVNFVELAAEDPHVLAIKHTLYRTSGDSPIVRALSLAAENGKQVTALVELQARFDEANNISWSREMERSGVHVVYGFMDLKTHCKLAMVVRQEGNKVRRYVHLGTGNYNPTTARLYTDLGLFTANKGFADDASALFNFLTGYSQGHDWQKLVVAPEHLHRRTIELIQGQTQLARQGKPARIFAKLNSLVDRRTIEALYQASQAGVPIDLVIRGICCLRPGMKGISENIRVRSIVDRFLEHSRIVVFGDGPDAQVFLSSADWMPRNFNRRVEVMFPVEDPLLAQRVREEIIPAYLHDNMRVRVLQSDGAYQRAPTTEPDQQRRAQRDLLLTASDVRSNAPAPMPIRAESNGKAPAAKPRKTGKRKKASQKR